MLLSTTGDYLAIVVIDADSNEDLNADDDVGHQTFTVASGEIENIDLLATP